MDGPGRHWIGLTTWKLPGMYQPRTSKDLRSLKNPSEYPTYSELINFEKELGQFGMKEIKQVAWRDETFPFYLQPSEKLGLLRPEQVQEGKQTRLLIPGNKIESKPVDAIERNILPIDKINSRFGITPDKVTETFAMTELKDMVW